MKKKVWIVKYKDSDRPAITETHCLYTIFSSQETADGFLKATIQALKGDELREIVGGTLIFTPSLTDDK